MALFVVKLGGSAITRKDHDRAELRSALVRKVCAQLHAAQQQYDVQLCIVHGAGPFGHVPVARHGLKHGFDNPGQLAGVCSTQEQVQRLGLLLVEQFLAAGLHPLLLSAPDFTCFAGGQLESLDIGAIRRFMALDRRLIPILGGCLVPDSQQGVAVASGDVLAPRLGRLLGAQAVLLGSDVDGVFNADPKRDSGATVIPHIAPEALEERAAGAEGTVSTDVTGGMAGKLRSLARQLDGTPACIFDLRAEGRLLRLLGGERVGGTWIGAKPETQPQG